MRRAKEFWSDTHPRIDDLEWQREGNVGLDCYPNKRGRAPQLTFLICLTKLSLYRYNPDMSFPRAENEPTSPRHLSKKESCLRPTISAVLDFTGSATGDVM
jgi:hypothetical protein